MHHIFMRASKVIYIPEKLYYYFLSPNSTLRGKMSLVKLTGYVSFEERLEFFREIGGQYLWGRALQQFVFILFKYFYLAKRDCSEYPEEVAKILSKLRITYADLRQQDNISPLVKIAARCGLFVPYFAGWFAAKLERFL